MPRWYELEKHQPVVREWHPQNKKQITDAKTGDREEVWWCCGQGHVYSERLTYRIHVGRTCPVCSGQITPAGSGPSITDKNPDFAGLAGRNGFCAETLSGLAWNCLVCPEGHEFVFSPEEPGQGCTRCDWRAEIERAAAGFNPGDIFASPIEYDGSLSEERLRRLLEEEGLRLHPANTAIKLREKFFRWEFAVPDIIICETRLAVEYDDDAFHKFREETDALKIKLLADVGWKLIRLRARKLPLLGPDDIAIGSGPTKTAARQIAEKASKERG